MNDLIREHEMKLREEANNLEEETEIIRNDLSN